MSLRRRPKPSRVHHTLRGVAEAPLLNEYSEQIVSLRGQMKRALLAIEEDQIKEARDILRDALSEAWR